MEIRENLCAKFVRVSRAQRTGEDTVIFRYFSGLFRKRNSKIELGSKNLMDYFLNFVDAVRDFQ